MLSYKQKNMHQYIWQIRFFFPLLSTPSFYHKKGKCKSTHLGGSFPVHCFSTHSVQQRECRSRRTEPYVKLSIGDDYQNCLLNDQAPKKVSIPSLLCHATSWGLQLCPTPHTHCMICHTPPGIKITENDSLCSRLPPCTLRVTFKGGSLDTSTLETDNRDTIFTMLHLCGSHYTFNIRCVSVTLFRICSIANIFSVHLCKGDQINTLRVCHSHAPINLVLKMSSLLAGSSAFPIWKTFLSITCFSHSDPLLPRYIYFQVYIGQHFTSCKVFQLHHC